MPSMMIRFVLPSVSSALDIGQAPGIRGRLLVDVHLRIERHDEELML